MIIGSKKLLALSLAANCGLAAGWMVTGGAKPETKAAPQAAVSKRDTSIIRVTRSAPATGSQGFDWSKIESEDFGQYMANLRAIGCPEETVQSLVLSEINQLFAPKFADVAKVGQ